MVMMQVEAVPLQREAEPCGRPQGLLDGCVMRDCMGRLT